MKFWITGSDIDGFRCDVAWNVPDAFWKKMYPQLRAMKNIFMLAESDKLQTRRPALMRHIPGRSFIRWLDIAAGRKNALSLDSIMNVSNKTFPAHALLLYFTSNHDENSWNKADYATMPGASHAPFAVLTQTLPRSVPLIYSGRKNLSRQCFFFYKDTIIFLSKYARAGFIAARYCT
jgi:glycosidase